MMVGTPATTEDSSGGGDVGEGGGSRVKFPASNNANTTTTNRPASNSNSPRGFVLSQNLNHISNPSTYSPTISFSGNNSLRRVTIVNSAANDDLLDNTSNTSSANNSPRTINTATNLSPPILLHASTDGSTTTNDFGDVSPPTSHGPRARVKLQLPPLRTNNNNTVNNNNNDNVVDSSPKSGRSRSSSLPPQGQSNSPRLGKILLEDYGSAIVRGMDKEREMTNENNDKDRDNYNKDPSASSSSAELVENGNPQDQSNKDGGGKQEKRSEKFAAMREFLTTHEYIPTLVLCNCGNGESEELARDLMAVYYAEKRSVVLRDAAIALGVKEYKNKPTDLLRGTNIYIAVLSEFMRLGGKRYLARILRPHVKRIVRDDLEIDKQRLRPEDNAQKNLEHLTEATRELVQAIVRSVSAIPGPIKQMIVSLHTQLGNVSNVLVVASVLFLRFLCPAVVSPKNFKVVHESPSPKGRRNLVLVAKLLQVIANNKKESLGAEQKESFLNAAEPVIKECIPLVEKFAQEICEEQTETETQQYHERSKKSSDCGKKILQWLGEHKADLFVYLLDHETLHCKLGFEHFLTKYAPLADGDEDGGNSEGSWILRNPLNLLKKKGSAINPVSPRVGGSNVIIRSGSSDVDKERPTLRSGSGISKGSTIFYIREDKSPREPIESPKDSPSDKRRATNLGEDDSDSHHTAGSISMHDHKIKKTGSLVIPGEDSVAEKKAEKTKRKEHRLTMDFSITNFRGFKLSKQKEEGDAQSSPAPLSARGVKGELLKKEPTNLNLLIPKDANHNDELTAPLSPRQRKRDDKKMKKQQKLQEKDRKASRTQDDPTSTFPESDAVLEKMMGDDPRASLPRKFSERFLKGGDKGVVAGTSPRTIPEDKITRSPAMSTKRERDKSETAPDEEDWENSGYGSDTAEAVERKDKAFKKGGKHRHMWTRKKHKESDDSGTDTVSLSTSPLATNTKELSASKAKEKEDRAKEKEERAKKEKEEKAKEKEDRAKEKEEKVKEKEERAKKEKEEKEREKQEKKGKKENKKEKRRGSRIGSSTMLPTFARASTTPNSSTEPITPATSASN